MTKTRGRSGVDWAQKGRRSNDMVMAIKAGRDCNGRRCTVVGDKIRHGGTLIAGQMPTSSG